MSLEQGFDKNECHRAKDLAGKGDIYAQPRP